MKRNGVIPAAALFLAASVVSLCSMESWSQQTGVRPRPGMNRPGQNQGGQNRQAGGNQDDKPEVKLPDDPKLLELHKNFVLAAEKLAGDYERTNQNDKARSCYTEILRLVPTYTPAAEKLAKIKEKESTAEKKLVDVYANKGWQDTGINVIEGKPFSIHANGQWTLKMTYNLPPDGIEIPKELRDFPLGALVGAISETSDLTEAKPFLVGTDKKMESDKPGRLYLRIYDSDPEDNVGRLGVMIEGTFKK